MYLEKWLFHWSSKIWHTLLCINNLTISRVFSFCGELMTLLLFLQEQKINIFRCHRLIYINSIICIIDLSIVLKTRSKIIFNNRFTVLIHARIGAIYNWMYSNENLSKKSKVFFCLSLTKLKIRVTVIVMRKIKIRTYLGCKMYLFAKWSFWNWKTNQLIQ